MDNMIFNLKIGNEYFEIMSNESILECAYKNGIKMNYYCTAGHCGRCKIKLISGEVRLEHSGGISREDIEEGFILACCSYPNGDIEI